MKEENNNTNVTDNERTNPETKLLNRDNDKNTYKLWKILNRGEKPRWVTVGEDGIIINNNPTKEELKSEVWDKFR